MRNPFLSRRPGQEASQSSGMADGGGAATGARSADDHPEASRAGARGWSRVCQGPQERFKLFRVISGGRMCLKPKKWLQMLRFPSKCLPPLDPQDTRTAGSLHGEVAARTGTGIPGCCRDPGAPNQSAIRLFHLTFYFVFFLNGFEMV